eukprot:3364801-Amphidinium_carterae.1
MNAGGLALPPQGGAMTREWASSKINGSVCYKGSPQLLPLGRPMTKATTVSELPFLLTATMISGETRPQRMKLNVMQQSAEADRRRHGHKDRAGAAAKRRHQAKEVRIPYKPLGRLEQVGWVDRLWPTTSVADKEITFERLTVTGMEIDHISIKAKDEKPLTGAAIASIYSRKRS